MTASAGAAGTPSVSAWTPAHLARLRSDFPPRAPLITAADVRPPMPGLDVWDMWPLALPDGRTAEIAGGVLWFALAAPVRPDPLDRHGLARIRLLHQQGEAWLDGGPALPDGFSPGSREWSGSAVLQPETGRVTLFFTAAGRRGESSPTMEQRLFLTEGALEAGRSIPAVSGWSPPTEPVQADDQLYARADEREGEPGRIKAFRDPAYFRDPRDGRSYLLFTATLKQPCPGGGAVGLAEALDPALERWRLSPPLLSAEGVNTELERPHALVRDGLYYLFWSTQRHTFMTEAAGPTGLYGMVSTDFRGPYRPLNGSGLVLANPDSEPTQAYSWWVTAEGAVTSFVDHWGLEGRRLADHPELLRARFGGAPAPFLRLRFRGDEVTLA